MRQAFGALSISPLQSAGKKGTGNHGALWICVLFSPKGLGTGARRDKWAADFPFLEAAAAEHGTVASGKS